MSQSALRALLAGKPAAKPAASPSAAASPAPASPPTSPAPAAAPSSSSAASAPSASTPPPAASKSPEPGPRASGVATPQGTPSDTLAGLLGEFTVNTGKLPQVNPPQAAAALAGPAAREVAGHPEPEKPKEEKVAPVPKPADVAAAEQAGKTRRTAAVVQVELDAALKRNAELEDLLGKRDAQLLQLGTRVAELETQLQAQADSVAQAAAGGDDQATLIEAVELIKSMRGEAEIQLDDNRKAWARVAELEEQIEKVGGPMQPAQSLDGEDLLRLFDSVQSLLPVGVVVSLTGRA